MLVKRGDAWIDIPKTYLLSGDTVETKSRPFARSGLWLSWCVVNGYTAARCSCTTGWTWFRNWSDAEKATAVR